jgi:preprotein translocase subunit SecF
MSEHKFRYMIPPGTAFHFVAKFKAWIWLSVLLTVATIAVLLVNKQVRGDYMNWTIDFKGGTELVFAFKDKSGDYSAVDVGKVRSAFSSAGEHGLDIGEMRFSQPVAGKGNVTVNGLNVKTPRFSALQPEAARKAAEAFTAKFGDREIGKAAWSGDRLIVRSKKPITDEEAAPVFTAAGLELKPWQASERAAFARPDEGNGEYTQVFAIGGLGRQYEQILEKALPDTDVLAIQSSGVGAKAGDKLRHDAAKSLLYAIALIMLYLAFRFDVRYAPGAAFAVIHDAVMVIGVYALTWTEVSLTTVAALLTVMGYSVNETVISFDRIRENEAKLKGKPLERIIDISINERLTRTIMTAATVFATTLIMNIFGTGLVRNFAFAMNVGVIVATYSSIFLAAPVFLWISKTWYSGPPTRRRGIASTPEPSPSSETDAAA